MNRLELALGSTIESIVDYLEYCLEDIEAGDTETYDCCGMPVELTVPCHDVDLAGCRRAV